MIEFFLLKKKFKRLHIKVYKIDYLAFHSFYKYSLFCFTDIIIYNFYMKFYFLYNIIRLIYTIMEKKSSIFNILLLFDKTFLYFRYINNKRYIVKYYRSIFWNIYNHLDVIININNPLIKEFKFIAKKNIPLITFSYIFLTRKKHIYSFLSLKSNINKIYLFYLYVLFIGGSFNYFK